MCKGPEVRRSWACRRQAWSISSVGHNGRRRLASPTAALQSMIWSFEFFPKYTRELESLEGHVMA